MSDRDRLVERRKRGAQRSRGIALHNYCVRTTGPEVGTDGPQQLLGEIVERQTRLLHRETYVRLQPDIREESVEKLHMLATENHPSSRVRFQRANNRSELDRLRAGSDHGRKQQVAFKPA
jgi:hypothetical protein